MHTPGTRQLKFIIHGDGGAWWRVRASWTRRASSPSPNDTRRTDSSSGGAALVLGLLVFTLPLSQVARMVESLAGEDTAIDVRLALQVTIVLTLGMALGWGVTLRVVWRQKSDLKRLRKRVDQLERELGARST